MEKQPVVLVFDVGKTNKKLLLFDTLYHLVWEESICLNEIKDEDGFPCEDVAGLTDWINTSFSKLLSQEKYEIKAINFAAHGASFVYLDAHFRVILPLYNYLKPYPTSLQTTFYKQYGGAAELAKQTASPVLGSLNSGLQVWRIKQEQPEQFDQIVYALHLPQYLSFIFSQQPCSELTSIGCHTHLWDFTKQQYHEWVDKEGIGVKFPPLVKSNATFNVKFKDQDLKVGIGLHDSSAALIPYLACFKSPFVLISTGTWCISLNPFNDSVLTSEELEKDCLSYLSYTGTATKASRLFSGSVHDLQVKKIATCFGVDASFYKTIEYDPSLALALAAQPRLKYDYSTLHASAQRKWSDYDSISKAYHQLIFDVVCFQKQSTELVLSDAVKHLFVDGGFGKNPIYMNMLAASFPRLTVCAAEISQATCLGAALAIHDAWNSQAIPSNLIELKVYSLDKTHMEIS